MKKLDAIIIGGGLAGLSCAATLADNNKNVQVLEASSVLGGRTSSWTDRGVWYESGLHRYYSFYKELPQLMQAAEIDVDDILHWDSHIEIRLPDGGAAVDIDVSASNDPVKSQQMISDPNFLPPDQVEPTINFVAAGLAELGKNPSALDKLSVAQLAKRHKVRPETGLRLYSPLTYSFYFLSPDECSAYAYFEMFNHVLTAPDPIHVGTFKRGVGQSMILPLRRYLESKRAEVLTDVVVKHLKQNTKTKRWTVRTQWGDIESNTVIVATALTPAQWLLKPFQTKAWFKPLFDLESQARLSLQLALTKPYIGNERLIFAPGTIIACLAETEPDKGEDITHVSIVLANPEQNISKSPAALLNHVQRDLERLGFGSLPEVVSCQKVADAHGAYRASPGSNPKRRPQKTPLAGLYLAGGHTNQTYMSSMEGMVIAGRRAAEAVLSE